MTRRLLDLKYESTTVSVYKDDISRDPLMKYSAPRRQ